MHERIARGDEVAVMEPEPSGFSFTFGVCCGDSASRMRAEERCEDGPETEPELPLAEPIPKIRARRLLVGGEEAGTSVAFSDARHSRWPSSNARRAASMPGLDSSRFEMIADECRGLGGVQGRSVVDEPQKVRDAEPEESRGSGLQVCVGV